MKAPDPIRSLEGDLFRPFFASGDLDARRRFLFGSGNAGAGGRLLISPAGAVLIGGAVPFRHTFGDLTVPSAESGRGRRRESGTLSINAQGALEGIDWGAEDAPDVGADGLCTAVSGEVRASGGAVADEAFTPEAVTALWQALKANDPLTLAQSLRGDPILPTAPRHVTQAAWSGIGAPAALAAETDERRAVSLDASSGRLSAELFGHATKRFLAFPFGYYGRRGCAPALTLNGALTLTDNGTARAPGEGAATIAVWRAATPPEDFLTPDDAPDGLLPQWEPLIAQTLPAGPFSIPLRLEGSTLHLFVVEAILDPAFADDVSDEPEPETDEDGHLIGTLRLRKTHANRSTATLTAQALWLRPAPADDEKPPAEAEG